MADDLTERVARALSPMSYNERHATPHTRYQARAALAAVADGVDGLADVLRAHRLTHNSIGGLLAECSCGAGVDDHAAHQAERLTDYIRNGGK